MKVSKGCGAAAFGVLSGQGDKRSVRGLARVFAHRFGTTGSALQCWQCWGLKAFKGVSEPRGSPSLGARQRKNHQPITSRTRKSCPHTVRYNPTMVEARDDLRASCFPVALAVTQESLRKPLLNLRPKRLNVSEASQRSVHTDLPTCESTAQMPEAAVFRYQRDRGLSVLLQ